MTQEQKEKLLELIEDYGDKQYQVACETGPDRDYRRFAQEEANEAKAEIVKFLKDL